MHVVAANIFMQGFGICAVSNKSTAAFKEKENNQLEKCLKL